MLQEAKIYAHIFAKFAPLFPPSFFEISKNIISYVAGNNVAQMPYHKYCKPQAYNPFYN